jgi:MarR family transcriptional regulator, 2-MHQ and catechol-resistance regulon repressor
MTVRRNDSDVARFRETVQVIYRGLGFLQRDQICCAGVTVPQCYALQILRREGELLPGELAERLGIDPSSATRAIDVLVRNGHVERIRPESGDRRRVILRLTNEGEALTDQLIRAGDAFFERVLGSFPENRRRTVVRVLDDLAEALRRTEGCCDPFRMEWSGTSESK